MMTLIEQTADSATYEFTHSDCTRFVKYEWEKDEDAPDFEKLAEDEYSKWLNWLNVQTNESNP